MEKLLLRFNSALVEKNKVMNLTAHKTEEESWMYNILDSLLFIDSFPETGKVLDLGSGCGCPAVPLKIMRPGLDITMIDSVNKKVRFLGDVVQELGLDGIRSVHSRIEDYTERGAFDIVTARAVASLPTLLEYAIPFLKVGGKLFAFKGSQWQDEVEASKSALSVLCCSIREVKTHGLARSLVIIEKTSLTDKKYPRAKNLPRIKPL